MTRFTLTLALIALGTSCTSEVGGATETAVVTELLFGKLQYDDEGNRIAEGRHDYAEGLNLDGRVSNATDLEGCRRFDQISPDGEEGIDNQCAVLFETIEDMFPGAVEGIIQGTINEGRLLLMIELDGVDDPMNDERVEVRVFLGEGRPDLSARDRIASHQTFDIDTEAPISVTRGRIEDGVLHASGFDVEFPVAVFNVFFDLKLNDAQIRATRNDAGGWDGMIGGGITIEQILTVTRMADDMQEIQITPILELVLPTMSDLDRDPETNRCNQLSAGMVFTSTPAFTFE